MTTSLRIVLDVNVLVRIAKAKRERRTGTAAQRIFGALETGRVCGRSAQIIASHRMIDSLYDVLLRLFVPAREARKFGLAIIAAMKAGPESWTPI